MDASEAYEIGRSGGQLPPGSILNLGHGVLEAFLAGAIDALPPLRLTPPPDTSAIRAFFVEERHRP
jgi:hypothetical protein